MPCSRNQFKILAILLMFIDHVGAFLLGNNILFRCAGRLAFPMFVFLLVDGYKRTRNVKKYLLRLASLYFLSIIPYSFACSGTLAYPIQNVYASLFLYLILFCILGNEDLPIPHKISAAALSMIVSYLFAFEYSWYGVLVAVVMFYAVSLGTSTAFTLLALISLLYGTLRGFPVQAFAALSIFLIPYQGEFMESERPNKGLSLVSYLFYPVHLFFLGILRL